MVCHLWVRMYICIHRHYSLVWPVVHRRCFPSQLLRPDSSAPCDLSLGRSVPHTRSALRLDHVRLQKKKSCGIDEPVSLHTRNIHPCIRGRCATTPEKASRASHRSVVPRRSLRWVPSYWLAPRNRKHMLHCAFVCQYHENFQSSRDHGNSLP